MKLAKFALTPPVIAISVALCAALSSFATEYFVSPGGKGDGSSWESPLGTIEAALVKSDVTGGKVREGYNPAHGYSSTMYYANCFCDTEVLNTKGLSGDPGYFSAAAGMYRPRSASPLVDQCGGSCALPKVDLRGKPRVFGKAADLGCYECQNFGLMLMVK